tara:strand:+ start:317 stop:1810 length:1494 start_codon:yes stop_codon:yes gene_type:complete
MSFILAIDQGTTSSRSIIFNENLKIIGSAQEEFTQYFPQSGWVEHNPKDLLETTIVTCKSALNSSSVDPKKVVAIGITNQRETTLVWDKNTGEPVYNAIVWQDRRTASHCEELRQKGFEKKVTDTTGLLLDPYFSSTKLAWILDNVEGVRSRAEAGNLLFGTVDSYLIWHLTGRQSHVTDATNAARTMLYDIRNGAWSTEMCDMLNIPIKMLPEVRDCAADFGLTSPEIFGVSIPIKGVAGDQHAATLGQACFEPGMMKSTYGTGCFALLNTGNTMVTSQNRMLTTIGYQLDGKVTYALEGSIFIAGAVVQWLRDGLKLLSKASQSGDLAKLSDNSQNLILVPAFTGLGAPYWNAECRGAIYGLTRNSGPAEFSRAALESVGFQTRDLLEAMMSDWQNGAKGRVLRVDGGMSASNWTMQFLSNILDAPVDRPETLETTAMGAAWLAGMRVGLYPEQSEFAKSWSLEKRFQPEMDDELREQRYKDWKLAVAATVEVRT